ncbi:MAG: toxin-antitoxin system HicB family antitoxin [Desulfurellaceae bacterium]|nr:toxin-antitoxin system HicB family antitoxin [Desulfurellaceae bacterium]
MRVGEALHQRLAVAARKADQSLNAFCVKALEKALGG